MPKRQKHEFKWVEHQRVVTQRRTFLKEGEIYLEIETMVGRGPLGPSPWSWIITGPDGFSVRRTGYYGPTEAEEAALAAAPIALALFKETSR